MIFFLYTNALTYLLLLYILPLSYIAIVSHSSLLLHCYHFISQPSSYIVIVSHSSPLHHYHFTSSILLLLTTFCLYNYYFTLQLLYYCYCFHIPTHLLTLFFIKNTYILQCIFIASDVLAMC